MAAADVTAFMKLWYQSSQDAERKIKRYLLKNLDLRVQSSAGYLSKLKVDSPIDVPVVRWMEEWGYPTRVTAGLSTVTLTITGKLFGATITADTVKQVIRVGTILERPTDRMQCIVTDVTGLASAPWDCTVAAYGGSTLSDDTTDVDYDIISEVWSDYKDAGNPRSVGRVFRKVGTQIHAETFEIPKTRKNTSYELVANEVDHQIQALLDKIQRQIGYAVLRSKPYWSGAAFQYGDEVESSTMCGLLSWLDITQGELANTNVFVNLADRAIYKDDLDAAVKAMWLEELANFDKGNWCILCHPNVHSQIQDWDSGYRRIEKSDTTVGFSVDQFDSKIGKSFTIMSERYMPEATALIVNFDACSYGYYNNDEMDRKEVATQGRYQRWLISMQTYGTVVRNPRANLGLIYGIGTD